MSGVLATVLGCGLFGAGGALDIAEAALVTELDFTSGASTWSGQGSSILNSLLNQDGKIIMGQYQTGNSITTPIHKGGTTFSLVTNNILGGPAPTATISGNTIKADLSSLFFFSQKGGNLHLVNIGGQATGLYEPQTSEFTLSWKHLADTISDQSSDRHKHHHHKGGWDGGWGDKGGYNQNNTFFLQGTLVGGSPAPVAIPASIVLFGTGLFGLSSWTWLKQRRAALMTA